jgi:hypothetical protein
MQALNVRTKCTSNPTNLLQVLQESSSSLVAFAVTDAKERQNIQATSTMDPMQSLLFDLGNGKCLILADFS